MFGMMFNQEWTLFKKQHFDMKIISLSKNKQVYKRDTGGTSRALLHNKKMTPSLNTLLKISPERKRSTVIILN